MAAMRERMVISGACCSAGAGVSVVVVVVAIAEDGCGCGKKVCDAISPVRDFVLILDPVLALSHVIIVKATHVALNQVRPDGPGFVRVAFIICYCSTDAIRQQLRERDSYKMNEAS